MIQLFILSSFFFLLYCSHLLCNCSSRLRQTSQFNMSFQKRLRRLLEAWWRHTETNGSYFNRFNSGFSPSFLLFRIFLVNENHKYVCVSTTWNGHLERRQSKLCVKFYHSENKNCPCKNVFYIHFCIRVLDRKSALLSILTCDTNKEI